MSPSDTHTHTQIHVSARAPRYAHTCSTCTHPRHHCSPTNKDMWNNHCKPSRSAVWAIDETAVYRKSTRPFASSLDFKTVAAQKGQRNAETFDSVSHLPSVAILSQALCCSHFVSQPFSTLLSFSWGCQMARVNPLHPPSIICDRFGWQTNRWADTQADRETEGRQMTGFDELYGDVCGKTDRRMCVGKQTDR